MANPSPGRLISKPPFIVIAVGLASVATIVLGWMHPEFLWGKWKRTPWEPPVAHRGEPALLSNDGALLPKSQAVALTGQCSRAVPAPTRRPWSPSPSQIQQLEADLAPVLRAIDDSIRRMPGEQRVDLRTYRRQYAGLELVTGERVIYVSAFDASEISALARDGRDTTRWRRDPLVVCDGWRGFWGIEYDPSTRRFRGFAFNGMA